jgi:hypothetical protein
LKYFGDHRCLSRSEESKYIGKLIVDDINVKGKPEMVIKTTMLAESF